MDRWHKYFFNIADTVAEQSRCLSRKVGAVIVRDRFVVSTGYNGPPMRFPNPGTKGWEDTVRRAVEGTSIGHYNYAPEISTESGCPRKLLGYQSGEGTEFCPCSHAERNAITIAARLGHPTDGCTLYLTDSDICKECAGDIVSSGISTIELRSPLEDYGLTGFTGRDILEACGGIVVREYKE